MSRQTRGAFDEAVAAALRDEGLQRVLRDGQDYMQAVLERPRRELDWPSLLEQIEEVRSHTVAHLDWYLEQFASNVEKNGGTVFTAATAAEACDYVTRLARRTHARLIVKSKSMVAEEIGLNQALEAAGAQVVETDLGEFIIQLAGERPFHIIRPAIHKSLEQIRVLLSRAAGRELPADPHALTAFARSALREKFLAADMGISGANFGVASSGTLVLLTNEGNGRLTTTLPRTHVVVMGMERLVPDFASLEPILAVLPWMGAGSRITSYVTAISGPRRPGDEDGPQELHVVIVDNGRSGILGGKYQKVLNCIRCGACLDVCPVYRKIGGHAYGSVYPGPIGAVLSPLLDGLTCHPDLPFASSLCQACSEVCSARIPLAEYLAELRADAVAGELGSTSWRVGFEGYTRAATAARLWAVAEDLGGAVLALLQRAGLDRHLPGVARAWTAGRDLPAMPRRSFRRLWRRRPWRDGRRRGEGRHDEGSG